MCVSIISRKKIRNLKLKLDRGSGGGDRQKIAKQGPTRRLGPQRAWMQGLNKDPKLYQVSWGSGLRKPAADVRATVLVRTRDVGTKSIPIDFGDPGAGPYQKTRHIRSL